MLENIDISAEVIDPRTMFPLDKQTLIESAKKTSRAIVVDEGYERYGVTAELAAIIADGAFYYLDAPVKRMGAMDVPIPFSPVLEDLTVPTPEKVTELAKTLCYIVPGWGSVPVQAFLRSEARCCLKRGEQKTWPARSASNWNSVGCSTSQWVWMRLNCLYCLPYRQKASRWWTVSS
jgi:hypothetical protein